MAKQVAQRRDSSANLALVTPADGEHGYDKTRKGGLWGDGSTVGGIPYPNFAEIIKGTWNTFSAVSLGSPGDPNNIQITVDSRFAEFLVSADLPDNARFTIYPDAENTGPVDLTVELGSGGTTITKNLKKFGGSGAEELDANDLKTGNPVDVIFDGTQFLIIGGIGGGGGGWQLLERQQPSGASTVDFETGLSGSEELELVIENLNTSAACDLYMRTNQGSGYQAAVSDYAYCGQTMEGNAATADRQSAGSSRIELANGIQHHASFTTVVSGRIRFQNAQDAVSSHPIISDLTENGDGGYVNDTIRAYSRYGSARNDQGDAGAITGIRILPSTGTITGAMTLYGRSTV